MSMLVSVVIFGNAGEKASETCFEECRRQADAIEAEGKYRFEIVCESDPKIFKTVWNPGANEAPDFCLWIESRLVLREEVIGDLLENSEFVAHKAVIAGTVEGRDHCLLSGGRTKYGKVIEPDPVIPVPCVAYDTSLLLVPSYAIKKLESPEDVFWHGFFDYACGSRVARAGVPRIIAPGVCAISRSNGGISPWKDPSNPFCERLSSFLRTSAKGLLRLIHSLFRNS